MAWKIVKYRFAFQNEMLFIEASAKTRQGIKQAFEEVVQKILDKPSLLVNTAPLGAKSNNARLDQGQGNRQNPGCC